MTVKIQMQNLFGGRWSSWKDTGFKVASHAEAGEKVLALYKANSRERRFRIMGQQADGSWKLLEAWK